MLISIRFIVFILLTTSCYSLLPNRVNAQVNKNIQQRFIVPFSDTTKLSEFDLMLIDSLVPIYYQQKDKNDQATILKLLAENISYHELWSKYNEKLISLVQHHNDSSSTALYANALNNKGYEEQYIFNDLKKAEKSYYKSYTLFLKIKNYDGVAVELNNLAYIYQHSGNIPKSISYYSKALTYFVKQNNSIGATSCYINIGDIYLNNDDLDKAVDYFKQAEKHAKSSQKPQLIANVNAKLARCLLLEEKAEEAKSLYENVIKEYIALNNFDRAAGNLIALSEIEFNENKIDKANKHIQQAVELTHLINNAETKSKVFNMASLITKKNNIKLARVYADSAYYFANEIGFPDLIFNSSKTLSELKALDSDYKSAYSLLLQSYNARETVINDQNKKAAIKQQFKAEFELKENLLKLKEQKDKAIATAEKKRQKIILYFSIGGIIVLIVFLIIVYNRFKLTQHQKTIIQEQKIQTEEKQREIIDSINYAKRLQNAILATKDDIDLYLNNNFLIYKPKDIVAGDFYFFETSSTHLFYAAADCTGHGVPGAMVSMVCANALTRCVREFDLTDPGKILDKTRELVLETFKKSGDDVKDGMDISLVVIPLTYLKNRTGHIYWAGANNPIWYIDQGELIEIKPDKQPIGKIDEPKPFTTHRITNTAKGIYLFTDGFADQFGFAPTNNHSEFKNTPLKGKKFKASQMKSMLLEIHFLPMQEQEQVILERFNAWKGNFEQIDDVCFIGIAL